MNFFKVFVLFALCFSSYADSDREQFELFGGLTLPLTPKALSDSADPALALNLNYRHYLEEKLNVGFGYTLLDFSGTKQKNNMLHALLGYDFSKNKKLIPYAQAGLGLSNVSTSGKDFTEIAMLIGAGMRYELNKKFSLNGLINLHHVSKDKRSSTEQNILAPMLGLTYEFGAPKETTKTVSKTFVTLADQDNDGIGDDLDQCPNTPKGEEVNLIGCPKKSGDLSIKLNVKFDSGKATIKSGFSDQLDKVGKTLEKYQQMNVAIHGHTDNTGSLKFNNMISEKRAQAVADYLLKNFDIKSSRISAQGFGPSKPIADNSTKEGRALNRRVEAVFSDR